MSLWVTIASRVWYRRNRGKGSKATFAHQQDVHAVHSNPSMSLSEARDENVQAALFDRL